MQRHCDCSSTCAMKPIVSLSTTIIFCAGRSSPQKARTRHHGATSKENIVRILLTNDDGIYAPGLRALRTELRKLGDVTVVAPAGEQSAVGHSITLLTPLIVQEVFDENNQAMGWAVEGKPADCVKLALMELLDE